MHTIYIYITLYHSTILKTIKNDFGSTELSVNSSIKQLFNGEFFKAQSVLSKSDINALKAYNAEIKRGVNPMTAYYRTMQNTSTEAQNLAASANGLAVDLEQIPKVSKAGQVALKGLSMAGNMLAFMAISTVIEIAVEKISELSNASKIAEEKAVGFADSVNTAVKGLSDNASTLSSLNSEYQHLSKGVNALGENVSLSASEYARYKEIIQQVSDIMPDMTTYFNSQGEAIAFATGHLSDLS